MVIAVPLAVGRTGTPALRWQAALLAASAMTASVTVHEQGIVVRQQCRSARLTDDEAPGSSHYGQQRGACQESAARNSSLIAPPFAASHWT